MSFEQNKVWLWGGSGREGVSPVRYGPGSLECGCLDVACVLLGPAPDMFYGARGLVRRRTCLTGRTRWGPRPVLPRSSWTPLDVCQPATARTLIPRIVHLLSRYFPQPTYTTTCHFCERPPPHLLVDSSPRRCAFSQTVQRSLSPLQITECPHRSGQFSEVCDREDPPPFSGPLVSGGHHDGARP